MVPWMKQEITGEAEQLTCVGRDVVFLYLALWAFYGTFVWDAANSLFNE